MKKNLYIFLLLFSVSLSSQVLSKSKIDFENLYGKWIFLNYFEGKFESIDNLSIKDYQSNFGTPFEIFDKSGDFISDQGDYAEKGKFLLDRQNKILKKIYKVGDTIKVKINYLDEKYLLLTRLNNYNYFYRKKSK
ncbi:MAG: hypothetical protein H7195_02275 [Chryseobacterium sp.]|nr:hypothetical protein [Chryseobacterium sp.]